MDPASLLVAEQVVSTTVEGAAVASIGIAQKTHPLSAAFSRITSENFLPRFDHSISVCNGRAYIFGGRVSDAELAGSEIHSIRLPLDQSNPKHTPDYRVVPALSNGENGEGDVPQSRAGHTAEALGDKIYMFGGCDVNGKPLDEGGRVSCYDTTSLQWSSIDIAQDAPYPSARYNHAATISEKPLPRSKQATGTLKNSTQAAVNKITELVTKSEPIKTPHGTLFVVSGRTEDGGKLLEDAWLFDIASARWTQLPALNSSLLTVPMIGLVDRRLYAINHRSNLEGEILSFDLPLTDTVEDAPFEKIDVAASIPQWQSVSFPTNALVPGPEARTGAGLLPITTGHGRVYLLYFFGEKLVIPTSTEDAKPSDDTPLYLSTLYTYQPSALPTTAAATKDATRSAINVDSGENSWAEVRVIPREEIGNESDGKSHPGPRSRFAYAGLGLENKGGGWMSAGLGKLMGKTEEDTESGYGVLVWGGKDARGEVTGDGWILRIR